MKKIIVPVVGLLAAVGIGAGGYFLFLSTQKTDQSVFEEIVVANFFDGEQAFDFEVSAKDYLASGAVKIRKSIDESQQTLNLKIVSGEAFEMNSDTVINGSDEVYQRINNVTAIDQLFADDFEKTFEPVIDKWVKSDIDDIEDGTLSEYDFEEVGPSAMLSVAWWFAPSSTLPTDINEQIFDQIIESEFYTVESLTDDTFDGQTVQKARVSIGKQALLDMYEMTAEFDIDEEEWTQLSRPFINDIYGNRDTLWANVYLDEEDDRVLGMDLTQELDEEFTQTDFAYTFNSVSVSITFYQDGEVDIEIPTEYIDSDEYDRLLEQGLDEDDTQTPTTPDNTQTA